MPRMRSQVHEARTPRTSRPKARRGRRTPSEEPAEHEGAATIARGEVTAAERAIDLGQLATSEELPGLADLSSGEANAPQTHAESAPQTPQSSADPAAALALADLACNVACMAAARGAEVPDELTRLSDRERALLSVFAPAAAGQLQSYSNALDKYGALAFLGVLGLFVWSRVRQLNVANGMAAAVTSTEANAQPESAPAPRASPPPADMPGSPFNRDT